jgi:hypothetical protein
MTGSPSLRMATRSFPPDSRMETWRGDPGITLPARYVRSAPCAESHAEFRRLSENRGVGVDLRRFDDLIQRLSTASLTRSQALRSLALSAAALAGVRLTVEPGLARKRNNKNKNEPKRRVCHCGRNNPQRVGCKTKRLPKDKVKQHLKRHKDDYKGRCVTPVSAPPPVCQNPATCTVDAQCCAGVCNSRGVGPTQHTCVACRTARADCAPGTENGCCAGMICPTSGFNAGRCCVEIGVPPGTCMPVGDPTIGSNRRCCTGNCDLATSACIP